MSESSQSIEMRKIKQTDRPGFLRPMSEDRKKRHGEIAGDPTEPRCFRDVWILIPEKEETMAKHLPVPPENRNPHDDDVRARDAGSPKGGANKEPKDPNKHGQQANTKQNTTHQGYQQDR
jgi:hypothetical protein